MFSTSYIELDSEALKSNLEIIRSIIGDGVKFSSVVKGNAYGHGIEQFVPMAEKLGVDHFSVFSADEALRVFQSSNGNSTIMIMGHLDNEEIDWAVNNEIEFFVFELDRARVAQEKAKKLHKKAKIHIEVETGMNRTGFNRTQLKTVVDYLLKHQEYFSVEGICTHFAGAESIANHVRVTNQIKRFNNFDKWIRSKGIHPKMRHTACSAASVSYPKSRMDMVRIGILQYGFWPSRETLIMYLRNRKYHEDPFKRVISWKSKVMDVKKVSTGEFIGYGTTFMASENMRIATVPVGYSHGYSRILSNQGRVLIKGTRLAVIGIVNMNLLMVDICECPEIKKGDEVVLIGNQEGTTITVSSFGELSNQLNYELLTRLPLNIPRSIKEIEEKEEVKAPIEIEKNGLHKA